MKKTTAAYLLLFVVGWLAGPAAQGAPTNSAPTREPFDYATPAVITGTIYAIGTDPKKVLFTFKRVATRTGSTVHVARTFNLPGGTVAATEDIVYESGRLVSDDTRELQAGTWGKIIIKPDPKNATRQKITISHGSGVETQKAGTTDDLPKDVLVNDSIYPFIFAHWDELMKGTGVKFRYPSLEWEKTFGFKLTKTGEGVVNGKPVALLRMEATSLIVSSFMAPLTFSAEMAGPHHVVEYLGRTTPKTKSGKSWKPLDADTVFDW